MALALAYPPGNNAPDDKIDRSAQRNPSAHVIGSCIGLGLRPTGGTAGALSRLYGNSTTGRGANVEEEIFGVQVDAASNPGAQTLHSPPPTHPVLMSDLRLVDMPAACLASPVLILRSSACPPPSLNALRLMFLQGFFVFV